MNKLDLYKPDKSKRSWGIAVLISFDQLVNTIFLGYPDETISSRAFREDIKWLEKVVNTLFFFAYQGAPGAKGFGDLSDTSVGGKYAGLI